MQAKKYLITGGTGFIGSALVRALVKKGSAVRILDNNSRGKIDRLGRFFREVEFIEGDVRDHSCVERSVKGVESVCHLAGINGTEAFYKKPYLVLEVAVKGMMNILDGCLKHGVKELILTSSSEVYQTPPIIPTHEEVPLSIPNVMNPRYSYGAGKIISESLTINYGRRYFERVLVSRPHNVYGPDMGCEHVIPQFILRIKEIAKKKRDKRIAFPIQGTGKETRSFVFIDDFIDGLMLVIEKGKHLGIYNIGTMDEISMEEVAGEVGKYFGKDVVISPGQPARGGTSRRCPDISKLKELGYAPKVSFQEGLKITAQWYDENL